MGGGDSLRPGADPSGRVRGRVRRGNSSSGSCGNGLEEGWIRGDSMAWAMTAPRALPGGSVYLLWPGRWYIPPRTALDLLQCPEPSGRWGWAPHRGKMETGSAGWPPWVATTLAFFSFPRSCPSLDNLTGSELSFSLFYAGPRGAGGLVRLRTGRGSSWAVWAGSTLARGGPHRGGAEYSLYLIPYWNALVRLGFFLIIHRPPHPGYGRTLGFGPTLWPFPTLSPAFPTLAASGTFWRPRSSGFAGTRGL